GADDAARHAHDDGAGRHAAALGDDRGGGDQALRADIAATQQPGPDADQRVTADAATVQDGGVAGDDALLDFLRTVGVGVDDAPVLQVDARPERDPRQVGADDRVEPDVHARGEDDVAADDGVVGDVVILDRSHAVPPVRGGCHPPIV